jgi:pyruvate kinase
LYGCLAAVAATPEHTRDVLAVAGREVRKLGWARKGQQIAVVSGRPLGKPGSTNTLVLHTV